ncbi:MAG: energy transducer TonB [Flavobacteriaceae bacterium]|jgi:outer membrane biosynthesis protein TonB|nr:energy transducer TonB [Flavobacteriaceae bacterium]
MNLKYSKEEKTSIVVTLVLAVICLVLLYFIRFIDTQTAHNYFGGGGGGGNGVAISLEGTPADYLKVETQPLEVKPISQMEQKAVEDVSEKEIVAYEKTESPVVVNQVDHKTKEKKQNQAVEKTEKVKKIEKKEVVAEKKSSTTTPVVQKPDVSTSTKSALSSFMNGGKGSGGGGNSGQGQGGLSTNGGYYGNGTGSGTGSGSGNGSGTGPGSGSGSGGGNGDGHGTGNGSGVGYSLNGRSALVKPVPKYLCNEVGRVVVEVYVDQNGNTIDARPGVKGSTNTANCLLEQAKIAAMQTKWQANSSAPEKQIGQIIYNFNLR